MTNRIICFFIPAVVSALGAIPLGILILAKFGLDSTSRTWKKLQPVRACLTAAVPSSIFYSDVLDGCGPRKSTLQLQHTVIELRDAIWRLQPYCPSIAPDDLREFLESYSVPTRDYAAAISALRVSSAVKAKTGGATPASTEAEKEPPPRARSASVSPSCGRSLQSDTPASCGLLGRSAGRTAPARRPAFHP
ncbi:DUF6545 domain-containing protein [Mycobacterium attenuatum]|uniref:DUF6545 domain-containing protein n=1 Tax=Mycobacterium attenuatum TaxID=2341086 RepID=UPI003CC7C57A